MPNIELDVPVYPIVCPKCHREQLLRFFDMTWETVVHCPSPCYESIRLVKQYMRSELEDIAERLGRRDFWSVHEPVTKIEEEAFLSGAREEQIEIENG